ncbi:hypothetical protein ILUMI_05780 [Ignelater luminosus]|uniref:Uncharacterized protein n=1 Tax=Ignelater luminosus TaxID=2038154 RepID=A0A8K0DBM4_IGNLU|nr:hypothetical protein ILUMI_05780 [Ignelater luminosus]
MIKKTNTNTTPVLVNDEEMINAPRIDEISLEFDSNQSRDEILTRKCHFFEYVIKDRRVVDLGYILTQYERIVKHSQYCTMRKMNFVKEKTAGLHYSLYFSCDNCDKTVVLSNNHPWKQKGVWHKHLCETMLKTGEEEKQHAVGKGNLTWMENKYHTL